MIRLAATATLFSLAACSGGATSPDGDTIADGAAGIDAATQPDASTACPRLPAPADRPRGVVVSHPYTAAGDQAGTYRVITLAGDGTLTTDGPTFTMGHTTGGEIAFTPDGEIGLVAQNDGTLGVFRLDAALAPEVIEPGLAGSFYASRVVVDPSGARAWVLDTNWRKNGGGLYAVSIACDGSIQDEGLVAAAKLPYALAFLGDGRAVVAATDLLSSTPGSDAHLVSLETTTYLGGVDAFGDDEAIVAGAAVTSDGRFFLLGDNSAFGTTPNRVAAVEIGDAAGLTATQVLAPIDDPVAIVSSPFGNSVLIASGFSDAFFAVDYDPSSSPPFTLRGELSYVGAPPQLPGAAVAVSRGPLVGRVLVAENVGVRQVAFAPDGSITDLGLASFGPGLGSIVGAIGVQP